MREMDDISSAYGSSPYGDVSHQNEAYAWESNKEYSRKTSSLSFKNSEIKRQRRVAKYKSYCVQTKLKSAIKNGVRWFRNKYSSVV
ncbi:hypothetical protein RchiOBHm_Chr4g0424301 [Rosa chinensis]|uniref:Uncharacterized protein n=1 Tax=Rosa chinensis TaxID=74649 RepID=A0A2P6QYU0_ROSCH|nr:hypothetical protein RchiOBHm_Chr4g0424301 [Rosa chinensis]